MPSSLVSTATALTPFWRGWLTVWCISVGLFGLVLAAAGVDAASGPIRLVFDVLGGSGPLVLNGPMRFSLAVCGAVTIGWSVTLYAAITAADMLGSRGRPVWVLIVAGMLGWFVIDSILSTVTGFWRNAVSNLLYIAAFLLPVWRSGVLGR